MGTRSPRINGTKRPTLRTIQSVDRAAELLRAVANSRQPLTLPELASRTGLNRSTAWRLLATLDAHGLVEHDPVSQRYTVGYAIVQIAAAGDHEALVRRARPALQRLANSTGETASLAVAKRFELVYVDQVEAPQVMAPNWLGRPAPLHATSSGKAFLAWLTDEERAALLSSTRLKRFTPTTITRRADLEAELAEVRERGYSVCAGELEQNLWGVSAAVLDARARPVAIISIWGPEHRVGPAMFPSIGKAAKRAVHDITHLLSPSRASSGAAKPRR
jgi:DNA-binding IclR family transcriptional regulator